MLIYRILNLEKGVSPRTPSGYLFQRLGVGAKGKRNKTFYFRKFTFLLRVAILKG
jgi:hypothetical protein